MFLILAIVAAGLIAFHCVGHLLLLLCLLNSMPFFSNWQSFIDLFLVSVLMIVGNCEHETLCLICFCYKIFLWITWEKLLFVDANLLFIFILDLLKHLHYQSRLTSNFIDFSLTITALFIIKWHEHAGWEGCLFLAYNLWKATFRFGACFAAYLLMTKRLVLLSSLEAAALFMVIFLVLLKLSLSLSSS